MKYFLFWILSLSAYVAVAQKKIILTPYQKSIQSCVDIKIDAKKIDSNKKLYEVISQFYALSSYETLFREVMYSQKGEQKKLKFEDGIIQIFNVVDEDDSFKLLSTEKFDTKTEDSNARHKIRSAEARINQLLFRADIKSDYQKVKEQRAKQLELNIIWTDSQIKSLNIEFTGEKKLLNCSLKEQSDICYCRNLNI